MFTVAQGRTIEDLFFYEKDQNLIQARRKLEEMKETKENLAKVSGIQNDAVLDKLLALEIRPETLTTLFMIPLVEIAWADGELHDKERDEVFRYVEKAGLRNKNIPPKIQGTWQKRRPGPELMDAWVDYIKALCSRLSDAERLALKQEVLADARAVASAAGGFLGFGKLSAEEQRVLDQMEAAFG